MASSYRPISDEWSVEQWREAYERAAAFLATGEKWVVGPAVVANYRRGLERALARERSEG